MAIASRDRDRIDGRSDIWSIGILLYESLVGEVPFEGGSVVELAARVAGVLDRLGRSFEIIFIDDGSSDRSWQIIKQLSKLVDVVHAIDHTGGVVTATPDGGHPSVYSYDFGGGPVVIIGSADWGPAWYDAELVSDVSGMSTEEFLRTVNPAALGAVKYKNALIGLPLIRLVEMLDRQGISLP